MLEIARIASGYRSLPRARDRCDHSVKLSDGTPDPLTRNDNFREYTRGLFIEGQNPALKSLREDPLYGLR